KEINGLREVKQRNEIRVAELVKNAEEKDTKFVKVREELKQELEDLRREYADYKHEALKEHVQLTHELAELKEENKVSIDEQTALEEDLQKANRRAENAENDLVKLQRKHKELSEKYNERGIVWLNAALQVSNSINEHMSFTEKSLKRENELNSEIVKLKKENYVAEILGAQQTAKLQSALKYMEDSVAKLQNENQYFKENYMKNLKNFCKVQSTLTKCEKETLSKRNQAEHELNQPKNLLKGPPKGHTTKSVRSSVKVASEINFLRRVLNGEVSIQQTHMQLITAGADQEFSALLSNSALCIRLEDSAALSWEFCYRLHKSIQYDDLKVVKDLQPYKSRIVQLRNYWQNLHTSSYCSPSSAYCKLLNNRLIFLENNRFFLGSLQLPDLQMDALFNDNLENLSEISIKLMDQINDLLYLQSTVFEAMGVKPWDTSNPRIRCLLTPLILVVADVSAAYEFLLKAFSRIREENHNKRFSGNRERFKALFIEIKKFFEVAASLEFFTETVEIPNLPQQAPDFSQKVSSVVRPSDTIDVRNDLPLSKASLNVSESTFYAL
ncbi:unnamed protein product, partial [Enterobius vermicularis]|uniref:ANTH domain-containing protein n=1 Tax=Enterobius vermicularis TaxID=51028 RepID=A0A0N4V9S3_ENTVE